MPRKAAGNGTARSRKKTVPFTSDPAVQGVPDVPTNAGPVDLEEQIRRRAYEIYLERGGAPGDEHQDWLAAEREVRIQAAAAGGRC